MTLNATKMAEAIKDALGYSDQELSKESVGFAKALIQELKANGLVSFAPGKITGVTAASSPLADGAGTGGKIEGLSASSLSDKIVSNVGYPFKSSKVSGAASGIVKHIMSNGKVVFAKGTITGNTTNTGASSGDLQQGAGKEGRITRLNKKKMAQLIGPPLGGFTSEEMIAFCGALIDHLQTYAEVRFKADDVTGVAPAGGGPLSAGTAKMGRIF